MDSERRRTPRQQFIAEAKVRELASGTTFSGRVSDLTIDGCFVDMLTPLPNGAAIQITIDQDSATFTSLGRVVYTLANMGMGIAFATPVAPNQLAVLTAWMSK